MRYWLDTEFIENGRTIDLMSIGLVSEDGRELYLQNSECQFIKANDWVWRNVFPRLEHFSMSGKRSCSPTERFDSGLGNGADSTCRDDNCPWRTRREIADEVRAFVTMDNPEFWGYFADYDWVVFCQLFGTMMDLPKGYPMYCRDIKQLHDNWGDVNLPMQDPGHNALVDARWNKLAYAVLMAKT